MDNLAILLNAIIGTLSGHFTSMSHRTYWFFLLCALILTFFIYIKNVGRDWSAAGFIKFVFPKKVWLSRSSWVDYSYFLINTFVMLLFFVPAITLIYPSVVSIGFSGLHAISFPAFTSAPPGVGVLYFLCLILVGDFLVFLSHYLLHKVPFLWQFHKVHHAAEVLNPMTVYRQHPVDIILTGVLFAIGTAIVHVFFSYVFSTPFSIWKLGGVNIVLLLFYIGGYNLRHSHIRLSFGPIFDRFLVSPAQHQLHHSSIEKHFDKNMGLVFATWDRLFGTHYIPEKDEHIELGLPNDEAKDFSSALQCYLQPFKKAFGKHKIVTMLLAVGLFGAGSTSMAGGQYNPPNNQLEQLTWNEVNLALKAGYRHVIIPTGGVEQNGLHVVLGKHKGVIKYTSDEIASRLGNTLVAPVIDYVPEGRISPPEGHMKYSGTISIREDVFEMVLEDTAKSLYQHGFTHIYIMGDSGSSVAAQDRATEKIRKTLKAGQHILHVKDYYKNHGQIEWLKQQGYTENSIGNHAGIRDTSELLVAMPEGIRVDKLRQTSQNKGANGAYWKANPELGNEMLELKINAGISQIERFNGPKFAQSHTELRK